MRTLPRPIRFLLALAFLSSPAAAAAPTAEKRVLLIAGTMSHGPGAHEHNAGVLLLQKCLEGVPGLRAEVSLNGWPKDSAALAAVDAVILYCDGGVKHLTLADNRLGVLSALARRGVGIGCIHYAVEPTKEKGQTEFLEWIGGAFETDWSVNPHWDAHFKSLPVHPVTRGVQPFTIRDEWYFNMRFKPGMTGVTPLLVAIPGIKVVAPSMACQVIDWAMQVHGGGGMCDDFPLAYAYAQARTLRFADGPDEVHRNAIAKWELGRYSVERLGA